MRNTVSPQLLEADFRCHWTGLLILRSWQLNQFEHCVSVMEVLEGDPQLSKISQALDASGLAGELQLIAHLPIQISGQKIATLLWFSSGYFGDKQLGATFFAPTDDAIKKSKWEDCTADDPRLLGSLLYHSVPMKVALGTVAHTKQMLFALVISSLIHEHQLITRKSAALS